MLISPKLRQLLLIWVVLVSFATMSKAYSGGSGTVGDPYRLANVNDLMELRYNTGIYSSCFILTDNIDMAEAGTIDQAVFVSSTPFTGKFDGNGKTISNLTISGTTCVGFFGIIGPDGEVFGLTLGNVMVTGTNSFVGGLCGCNNYGTIIDCRVSGLITGLYVVGGLCGGNAGVISDCRSSVITFGGEKTGGLCGENFEGEITGCYSDSTVNSYGSYAGGLCGGNGFSSIISRSYATGNVSGSGYGVGGLVGGNQYSEITDSYSTGSVSGVGDVGGLCGRSDGFIKNCYSTGSVTGDNNIGGLCGYSNVNVENCFWDVNTSGIGNSGDNNFGATGLTTAAMQSRDTFVNAGWDIIGETGNGTEDIWQMDGYPVFVPGVPIEAFEVHIGTAQTDSYFPLRTSFLDCRTQSIYTSEQIGYAGQIRSLSLDIVSVPGQMMNNFTIRLKHTQLAEYEFTPTSPAWESEGWTVVYQANQTIDHTGDFEFVFSTPFAYNGTDNLMVDISFNNDINSSNGYNGFCWSTGSGNALRTVVYCVNNQYGDPLTWSGSGMPRPDNWHYVPDITLKFSDGGDSEYTTVPDIAGLTQEQAESEIIAAGLVVGAITQEYSKTVAVGSVISQSIQAGNFVKKDRQMDFAVSIGNSLPGNGWQYDPYIIDSLAGFKYFCENTDYWGQGICVRLDTDLDLSGIIYSAAPIAGNTNPDVNMPYVGTPYTGNFDGNGHVIRNLTINGNDYCGLFGNMGYGNICNLGLESVSVTGKYWSVGGVCGFNSGNIKGCYVRGNVSCDRIGVGGICGINLGSIIDSYSTGSVTGEYNVGGLCGDNSGTIISSYSSCDIAGNGYIGGLCGYCYGTITSSFWDVEASGTGNAGDNNFGAIGKNTAEMQTQNTFSNAGWDFSTTDGDAADWQMRTGNYPLLSWQLGRCDIAGALGVEIGDLEALAGNWLAVGPAGTILGDLDNSGAVDLADFAIMAGNWLK